MSCTPSLPVPDHQLLLHDKHLPVQKIRVMLSRISRTRKIIYKQTVNPFYRSSYMICLIHICNISLLNHSWFYGWKSDIITYNQSNTLVLANSKQFNCLKVRKKESCERDGKERESQGGKGQKRNLDHGETKERMLLIHSLFVATIKRGLPPSLWGLFFITNK